MKLYLKIIAFFIGTTSLFSQSRDNYNMWYQYLLNSKLNDKMSLTALSQYRSFDLAYDSRLFLVSAYVDYKVTNTISPAAGFMVVLLESYDKDNNKKERVEKRPFQQVTMNDKIGRTSLSHRFRVEERFISNPNTFIMRLRYLASFKIPLNKSDAKQTLYGIVKDEIRMQMTKDDPFDSNRITVGLGINVSKQSAIEIGFINQMEERKTSNYFHVGFRNKFDWSKKKKTE
ncbi:DUF2490 domain-containing protein [Chishuiella sp.]|uniref:DUF2490 domain-containing protein n=1 Tax=Chishuiella sp. TaxID=1969467 RepID=UPI0028ABAF99|nr:DUF2490 domain-containing protein [Chishuiella sp.]